MDEFEVLKRLLVDNRSVRRFKQRERIGANVLKELVGLTRYCASGRNMQPLRYRIVSDAAECAKVFPELAWAGYFKDWDGPCEGERPVAYLVQCLDTRYGANCLCDDGLQLEAITLGASARGIGGCIIKSFGVARLKEILALPEGLEPRYVLALGYQDEDVVLEDTVGGADADIKYYRTSDGVHHVPKRPVDELLV